MKAFFFPGATHWYKVVAKGELNIDSLMNDVYDDIKCAIGNAIGLFRTMKYIRNNTIEFIRKKRKRKPVSCSKIQEGAD